MRNMRQTHYTCTDLIYTMQLVSALTKSRHQALQTHLFTDRLQPTLEILLCFMQVMFIYTQYFTVSDDYF
jgi:hypothetical protein